MGTYASPWSDDYRSYVRVLSNAGTDREALLRLIAAGDNGAAAQAVIDLYSLKGDDGTHSRIDLDANIVRLTTATAAPVATPGQPLNNGSVSFPDGSGWHPATYATGGKYLVARLGGGWRPFAQAWGEVQRFGAETTNYAEIDGGGSLTFTGNAREWPRWATETQNSGGAYDITKTVTRVNSTSGSGPGTLPTAVGSTGTPWVVYKVDSSANPVTITGTGGELINGAATFDIENQWDSAIFISLGTGYETIVKPGVAAAPGSGLTHPEVMARTVGVF